MHAQDVRAARPTLAVGCHVASDEYWRGTGLYLGHGLGFVARYWYLTTYYFVPWVVFLPTALWLDANERPVTTARSV